MINELKKIFTDREVYIISTFFGFVLGILLFTFYTPNYFKSKTPIDFVVEEGQTFNQIIDSLQYQGIIQSKANLKIAAFIYGADKKIKAGRYKIDNGLTYLDLLEILIEGSPGKQKRVTIPEGIWQHKLAGLLKNELGIDSSKFMSLSYDKYFLKNLDIESFSAEGYLLPETYFFYTNSTEKEILTRLAKEMKKIFTEEVKDRMQELGMSKNEVLTLASIIEGESNIVSEFKTISGVYQNRLRKGWMLQADPTIQYLIRNRNRYNRVLFKDLEINSPYNTYQNTGLPPSPINNPGKDAVMAALYPENHDYFYFVADGTGGHKFSKSYSEHLRGVNEYRTWRSLNK